MDNEDMVIELTKNTEGLGNLNKRVDAVCDKVDKFQFWFIMTLGGLAVNLIVLLFKK